MRGQDFKVWPQILTIGAYNRIHPYHFMMIGVCYVCASNPALGLWLISRIFFAFVAFEYLGIIIGYLHKWTDEAGTPLWSSVEYGDELYQPPCHGWGWGS